MVEQMQVRGTFEEVCKNLLIEKEVLRVLTEAGLAGKGKVCLSLQSYFLWITFLINMTTLNFSHTIQTDLV